MLAGFREPNITIINPFLVEPILRTLARGALGLEEGGRRQLRKPIAGVLKGR